MTFKNITTAVFSLTSGCDLFDRLRRKCWECEEQKHFSQERGKEEKWKAQQMFYSSPVASWEIWMQSSCGTRPIHASLGHWTSPFSSTLQFVWELQHYTQWFHLPAHDTLTLKGKRGSTFFCVCFNVDWEKTCVCVCDSQPSSVHISVFEKGSSDIRLSEHSAPRLSFSFFFFLLFFLGTFFDFFTFLTPINKRNKYQQSNHIFVIVMLKSFSTEYTQIFHRM